MILQGYGVVKADTHSRASVAASTITSSGSVLAANSNRQKFHLQNASTTVTFYITFATAGSTTDYAFKLNPGDYYEDENWTGAVYAIASASSSDVLIVTEVS